MKSILNNVVVMRPGETAHLHASEDLSLESLQKMVGGYLEQLAAVPREFHGQRVVGYVNEEGRMLGLHRNVLGSLGAIVVTGIDSKGETVGLNPGAAKAVIAFLNRQR